MLYIFQYTKPSPHYIGVVIPRCKNMEFDDNPNVVLPIGGDLGVFNEEKHLSKFTALLDELQGPILPAIRHMELGKKAWLKDHIVSCKITVPNVWICRPLSTLYVYTLSRNTRYSEFLQAGTFSCRGEEEISTIALRRVSHLPLTSEASGYFVNYILYLYSLFISIPNYYHSVLVDENLESYLDFKSGVKTIEGLDYARRKFDYLKFLSPEQSASWYAPLNS